MKNMKWIIGLALVLLLAVGVTAGAMAVQQVPTIQQIVYLSGTEVTVLQSSGQPDNGKVFWYKASKTNNDTTFVNTTANVSQTGIYNVYYLEAENESFVPNESDGGWTLLGQTTVQNATELNVVWPGTNERIFTYSGSAYTPVPLYVTVGEENAPAGSYEISYAGDNINANPFNAIVNPAQGYMVSEQHASCEFTINPKSLTADMVGSIGNQTYSGNEIKLSPTVKDGEKTLNIGGDYTVAYQENDEYKNVGSHSITVNGTGNYTGTQSVSYNIVQAELYVDWKWDGGNWPSTAPVYDGNEHTVTAVASCSTTLADGALPSLLVDGAADVTVMYAGDAYQFTAGLSTTDSANFRFANNQETTKSLKINKTDVSISQWPQAKSTEYNAQAVDAFTAADGTFTGGNAADYDVAWYWVTASGGETTAKDAGDYKAKAVVTIKDAKKENYNAASYTFTSEGTLLTIRPYPLTLTWSMDDTANKTEAEYNAIAHPISVSADVKNDGTQVASDIVSVTDAGTYTATVAVTGDAKDNYSVAAPSQEFTITPIALNLKWTLDGEEKTKCTYDTQPHEIKVTSDQILAADKEKVLLTPSIASITDAGEYVIEAMKSEGGFYTYYIEDSTVIGEASGSENVTAVFTPYNNYKMPDTVTQTFTIDQASLEGAEIVLAEGPYVYNGEEQNPTVVSVTLEGAKAAVAAGEYSVSYGGKEKNIDASKDTATVTVTAKDGGNYKDSESVTFTIEPKDIADATIIIAPIDDQTYQGTAIEPVVTVTDSARTNAELKEGTDFTVEYKNNVYVADKPVITLTGKGNYTGTNDKTTFKIVQKEAELKWADTDLVYNREKQLPTATVANLCRNDAGTEDECTVTVTGEQTNAGSYVATATALSNPNYKLPAANTQEWIIKRLPVAEIKITVEGPAQDRTRLGGPNADQYHTITLEGEPGEAFTATVSGGGTIKDKFGSDGKYTAKISGDALGGAALDGSGDVENTITVEYDDKVNLTTAATASADAAEAAGASGSFIYDTTAKEITVHDLKNRNYPDSEGVTVDLPEGYRKISFASTGAGEDFTAEATDEGGREAKTITIPFTEGKRKLNSTKVYGSSYSGTYEDFVGNVGSTPVLEIYQASASVTIDGIDPQINEAGRISATGSVTFTYSFSAPGGYSEAATFFGARNLEQGSGKTITISANQLHADASTTPGITFDDLEGGASYQSFVYDPVCDDPILTAEPTAGCYYMTGLAEPGSVVTVEVNGQKVKATADAYGTFVIPMPLTEEGDTITMHITDTAGNTITREYTVGAEQDPVEMDAFMMGHTFTNAHGNKDGELKYAMVLTAKVDDLKSGKVSIPILAGNMVTVGTIDVVMDENGNLSYTYELDEGVELVGDEKLIANTKLDREAFLAMEGIEISPEGTYVEGIKNKTVYLCAKFRVRVPAEKLQDTFHTKKITESEMKRKYRDLQNGKIQ